MKIFLFIVLVISFLKLSAQEVLCLKSSTYSVCYELYSDNTFVLINIHEGETYKWAGVYKRSANRIKLYFNNLELATIKMKKNKVDEFYYSINSKRRNREKETFYYSFK